MTHQTLGHILAVITIGIVALIFVDTQQPTLFGGIALAGLALTYFVLGIILARELMAESKRRLVTQQESLISGS